jgi:hypothetical protein
MQKEIATEFAAKSVEQVKGLAKNCKGRMESKDKVTDELKSRVDGVDYYANGFKSSLIH